MSRSAQTPAWSAGHKVGSAGLGLSKHLRLTLSSPTSRIGSVLSIGIMEAEQLVDRAAEIGAYLLDGLRGLMDLPVVGDVRGKGLLIGIELVKDRYTK